MRLLHNALVGSVTSGVALTAFASTSWAASMPSGCKILCFHGAPAPVAGAGLPLVIAAGLLYFLVRRGQRSAH